MTNYTHETELPTPATVANAIADEIINSGETVMPKSILVAAILRGMAKLELCGTDDDEQGAPMDAQIILDELILFAEKAVTRCVSDRRERDIAAAEVTRSIETVWQKYFL